MSFNFGAVTASADDDQFAFGDVGRLKQCLPATAARGDWLLSDQCSARSIAARNRDAGNLLKPEAMLGGRKCALLGAYAKAVAGVLEVGAGHQLPICAQDRATDGKVRIRRISAQGGIARGGNQLFIGHGSFIVARHGGGEPLPV